MIQSHMDLNVMWKDQDVEIVADVMAVVCAPLTSKMNIVNCL